MQLAYGFHFFVLRNEMSLRKLHYFFIKIIKIANTNPQHRNQNNDWMKKKTKTVRI